MDGDYSITNKKGGYIIVTLLDGLVVRAPKRQAYLIGWTLERLQADCDKYEHTLHRIGKREVWK